METMFHISNCPPKYQVKYVSCTLLDGALTWWNSHKRTVGMDTAYAMTWKVLMKLMTKVYCPRNEIQKVETKLWHLTVKVAAEPTRLQDAIRIANHLMDRKLKGYAVKNAENKRRFDYNSRDNHGQQKQPFKRQNVNGQSVVRAYMAKNNIERRGNKARNNKTTTKDYAIRGGGADPESNVVTGMFLLNNCYASLLFDSGADRSFVSTTFSDLLDVIPSTLDTSYAVELADGRIYETNVILKAKYHVVIVYDKKIVRVPYGDGVLVIEGDGCNGGSKSNLNIISCTKTQKYIQKGCQVYLAQVTAKKTDDQSEGKRLEDVPIIRDFPEVFIEDLPGLPPVRKVKF
ncbi:putative reverse transcriptase domain-containing protein [Tanacetum coccineum]